MKKKERIDILLVEKGLLETREKAKRTIMAGLVLADGERIDKPGTKVDIDTELRLKGQVMPYVGRGGFKLKRAIEVFQLDLKGKTVLDIGASTGGFTDCALQEGAKLVYALDVGYNQLAWKLRQDDRVVVMERTNFRYSTCEDFRHGLPHVATIDVSFISLKLILPVLKNILAENGQVSALIKPQFEAGRADVGKRGIVREKKVHIKVIKEMIQFCEEIGFKIIGLTASPIRGGEGNIEFLLHLILVDEQLNVFPIDQIEAVVDMAHLPLIEKETR